MAIDCSSEQKRIIYMNINHEKFGKGIGFILFGIFLLIFSFPSFVEAAEGKHFGGVYGTILGLLLLFDGIRRVKNSLSSKK